METFSHHPYIIYTLLYFECFILILQTTHFFVVASYVHLKQISHCKAIKSFIQSFISVLYFRSGQVVRWYWAYFQLARAYSLAVGSSGKAGETDSIKFKISSKTSRGKRDSTKRHYQRHHQQQPGEQQFPIQVVTGYSSTQHLVLPIFYIYIYNKNNNKLQHTTSKITKESKQKSRLGTTSNKITGGRRGLN